MENEARALTVASLLIVNLWCCWNILVVLLPTGTGSIRIVLTWD